MIPPEEFLVTTAVDEVDFTNSDVSLREAVISANHHAGLQEITFAPALSGSTIVLSAGRLELIDDVTITGPGSELFTIDAGGVSAILTVDGGDVTVSGLTLTNAVGTFGGAVENISGNLTIQDSVISNSSAEAGGGIGNAGNLTLERVVVSDNSAEIGGGIDNAGIATIIDSTFTRNSATGANVFGGGGISNTAVSSATRGTLTLVNSTVYDNTSDALGGGIWNFGTLTAINSTIAGNSSAADFGGGIYHDGLELNLTNVTVAGHFEGGGIASDDGSTMTVNNTLIAGNMNNAAAADVIGTADLTGRAMNSLIGDSSTAANLTDGTGGNIVGVDWTTVLVNSGGLPTSVSYTHLTLPTKA